MYLVEFLWPQGSRVGVPLSIGRKPGRPPAPTDGASGAVLCGEGGGGVLTSPNVPRLLLYLVTHFFTLGLS